MESGVNPRAPFFLGLETGGTKLVAAVLDDAGRGVATCEATRPAAATARETLVSLERLGFAALNEAGLPPSALAAVGWGFGGPVDRRHNRPAVNFHEPGWGKIDAAGALTAAWSVPVFIENDCKVAGLAEALLGAGSQCGLTVYLTLGSGVGAGLIWNGAILASGPLGEGEIGHLNVVRGGAACACGGRGCLEAYCSGWGVGERAVEAINAGDTHSPLMRRVLAAEPRARAEVLLKEWPGDAFAREQGEQFLDHLAEACAALCLILAPGHLVIGGGLARLPWLAEELSSRLNGRLPKLWRGATKVRLARLGPKAVSHGAALHARERWRTDN